jgi:hypothetical protein
MLGVEQEEAMPPVSPPTPGPSVFEDAQRQFFGAALARAEARALQIAQTEDRAEINYYDAFKALEEQFGERKEQIAKPSWAQENAFLLIITAMTITFGAMGLLPYFFSPTNPDRFGFKPDAFLDMAKLFAGVIVGGAAGATVATSTTRRGKTT